MQTGTVKFFNLTKGYGFIKDDDSSQDVFVHITGLLDQNIKENDRVSFETMEGRKGKNAVNVKKL